MSSYIKGLFHGLGTLLTGMKVTGREFFTKKVTEQYPENRATLKMFDRFCGELTMPHDAGGKNKCMAVTTKRILRAATYLLFVLFGTAGIYFQLNYSFLGAVQLLIYAGGITVLYVFSILLTSSQGDKSEDIKGYKLFVGLAATLLSLGVCLYVTLRHDFMPSHFVHGELDVQTIGHALMSSGKYGYVLPFEVISILLLACIVGGILIARKR